MNTMETNRQLRRISDDDPALAPEKDADGEPHWGAVLICRSISSDDFLCWLEHDDSELARWRFEPETCASGRVVVYSTATPVHLWVANAIVNSIRNQVALHVGSATLEGSLVQPVSMVCHVGDRLQCPDDALVPVVAEKDRPPTVVVEVAYLNESSRALQARLFRWMDGNAGVQVAIGIKVFSTTKRTAMVLRRGADPQFVEFGGRARGGIVAFPLRALYADFPLPSPLFGKEDERIVLKLIDLVRVITRAQSTMPRHHEATSIVTRAWSSIMGAI